MNATVEAVIVCDPVANTEIVRFEVALEENPQFDGKEQADRIAAAMNQDLEHSGGR